MNWTTITGAIAFTDVLTALGAAAVALIGVAVARKGAKLILGFIR